MSFGVGFSVGDVILVSQLAWKTWQACTSGRKAAPGEFSIVESELYALSSALEHLATLWAAGVDSTGMVKDLDGLKGAVLQCERTIEEFNTFLEKHRPMIPKEKATTIGTISEIEWTARAKRNWKKIIWVTQKDTLAGFRARLNGHLQILNTLIQISERHATDRLEHEVKNISSTLSNLPIDDPVKADIITPPPTFESITIESYGEIAALPVAKEPGYFDYPHGNVVDQFFVAVADFGQSYPFSFAQRKQMWQSTPLECNIETDRLPSDVGTFLSRLEELVELPVALRSVPEYSDLKSVTLGAVASTVDILATVSIVHTQEFRENVGNFSDRTRISFSQADGNSMSQLDTDHLGFVYLRLIIEILIQLTLVMKVVTRSELKIYPMAFHGKFGDPKLTESIRKLAIACRCPRPNTEKTALATKDSVKTTELRDARTRFEKTINEGVSRKIRDSSSASSLHKLRSWIQPSDEVEEERVLQSSRQWPSTCSWIFNKRSYIDWFSSTTSSILWFYARPGSGKSVLASHLIHLFEEANETAAYFCFRYNDDILRSPQSLLRSFAFQISRSQEKACKELLMVHDEGVAIANAKIGIVWKKLFLDTILQLPFNRPIYLIIDALDEAEPSERLPFMALLADISKSINSVKVVIFSRYVRDIANQFSQMTIPVEELTPDDNAKDIQLFASERIQRSPMLQGLEAEILPKLISRSNGSFIWVAKTLNALDARDSKEDILQALDELPVGMDELYARILRDMSRNTESQVEFSKTVLQWVLCAVRPLLLPEISYVIQNLHGDMANIETSIKNTCGQLISIDNSQRVQVNHMTVHEYLTQDNVIPEFRIRLETDHHELALFCLERLGDIGLLNDIDAVSQLTEKFAFIEYASAFWSHHLAHAEFSEELASQVTEFLGSENFYGWLQAMSLTSNLHYLEKTVSNIESWAQKHNQPEILSQLERLSKISAQLGHAPRIYVGAQIGDKKTGFGTCKYANGDFYEGNWENDMRHGFGECTYTDGQKYVGWWERDDFHGQGTLEGPDGCKYVGEWVAGRKQGYGVMTWTWMERCSYHGTWKDDRPHGRGTISFFLGSRYEGEWRNGCEHGKGKTMYWQGNHFEGDFEGGYEMGDVLKGKPESSELLDPIPDENGAINNDPPLYRLRFASGGVYEGPVSSTSGMPHGQGTLFASTGIVFRGMFEEGYFHGPGIATRPNGGTMKGTWIKSVAVGQGFEDINDRPGGGRYVGDMADTSRHGQGVLESASGFVYTGTFRYNEMHGEGVRRYENGDVYEGGHAHGSIHGLGRMVYASGATYTGAWNNGKKHGVGILRFPEGHVFTGDWAGDLAVKGAFVFALQPEAEL